MPEPGDEVLVAFEGGDPRTPFVLGALWNGTDTPPETMDGAGRNNVRVMYSRNGVTDPLDDTDGAGSSSSRRPAGSGSRSATVPRGRDRRLLRQHRRLESSGVTITASGKVTVTAATAEISAGMLSVNAGMSTFSGVVKADTVITNSVVSAAYTPGAGNIW